jgi:WD40 repeat protein
MDSWEQTGTLSGHRGLVLALACYGEKLFSGSDDRYEPGLLVVAEALPARPQRSPRARLIDHADLTPHPYPSSMCVALRRCIRVWRMGTWECERVLTGHNGGVVGVCIVQGNLISASNDSFIKVWNSTGVQRPFTAK